MPERPPNCRTAEIACTISKIYALPPKLAGKGVDVAYNSLSSPQVLYRKTNGDTVLHMSVRRRDLDLAKLFIEHGAKVDAQNVRPLTGLVPLVLADSVRV